MFEIRTATCDLIATTDTLLGAVEAALSLPSCFRPYAVSRTLTSADLDAARIGILASALYERAEREDLDTLDLFQSTIVDLSDEATTALALAMDLCPKHHCDVFICADDDVSECADVR